MADETTQPTPPVADAAETEGRMLLLVDDEAAVRRLAAVVLRRAGFAVVEAENGHEALTLFEQHGAALVGAVVDYSMPGMNGVAFADTMAARGATLPIVLMTGFGRPPNIPPGASALIRRVLEKPFAAADLKAAVLAVVNAPPAP